MKVPEFDKKVPEFEKKKRLKKKCYVHNNKNKENSPNTLNKLNYQASSQNFRKIIA